MTNVNKHIDQMLANLGVTKTKEYLKNNPDHKSAKINSRVISHFKFNDDNVNM
jgi:hypothetical protein